MEDSEVNTRSWILSEGQRGENGSDMRVYHIAME